MRGPTAPPDSDSRRGQILTAALACFSARGVEATSIDEIRERSGASVGSIYHHFDGKEAIAGALYLEGLADYQGGFVQALEGAASARAGIEAGVHHHIEWISSHRDLARFLFLGRDANVVMATERALRDLNRRFFRAVASWIEPYTDRGELQALPTELLTALWIGPSTELARHWLGGRSRKSLQEAAPVLAEAAWTCLRKESNE